MAVMSDAWQSRNTSDRIAAFALFALISFAMYASWIPLCRYLVQHLELLSGSDSLAVMVDDKQRGSVAIAMTVLVLLLAFVSLIISLSLYAPTLMSYLATLSRCESIYQAGAPAKNPVGP